MRAIATFFRLSSYVILQKEAKSAYKNTGASRKTRLREPASSGNFQYLGNAATLPTAQVGSLARAHAAAGGGCWSVGDC